VNKNASGSKVTTPAIAAGTGTATTIDTITAERKLENATEGLPSRYLGLLQRMLNIPVNSNRDNVLTICDYIQSLKSEINLSNNYRRDVIEVLYRFSTLFNNKSFMDITREDVISFLDSFRKIDSVDPLHKWVGTYNVYAIHLTRFFKWLYNPSIEPGKRPKPEVVQNIPQLKRKERSIYKPTDLWTQEDDSLFLKYCPNAWDRCYHAMSRDSAGRPHELLKLRIKDVVFKLTPDKKQYAEILVNGKTGIRPIPLIDSIPYIKDWISQHPQGGNPNSILLCGFGKSLNRVISILGLHRKYANYRNKFFPKLLDSPAVLPEDKQKIKELLKKPWNPYIRRHSALTEKSMILKEHTLRQFAGWSPGSNMHLKYLHYFGNESNDSILEAYGIITKDKHLSEALRPKQCPNCNEPNKPDSKFCAKCRMVLTYDAYSETLESEKQKEDKLSIMEKQFNSMQSQMQSLVSTLSKLTEQGQVNTVAQTLYSSGILKEGAGATGK
jgi:integrase